MRVVVNGEPVDLDEPSSMADLLRRVGARSGAVAVERNGAIVRRRDLEATRLQDGDRIELVTLVGGG